MNKKICFISLGNLYLCPYISKYISLIDCDYDIIYWDRHEINEKFEANQLFAFKYKIDESKGKVNKAIGYLKFKHFASKIIENTDYDGVILLQTIAGVLLQNSLTKYYKNKYILDIRDYTMEKNPVFYNFVKKLIANSSHTVISSSGYKKFLPQHNYTLVHNDSKIGLDTIKKFQKKSRNKSQIIVSYIGLIRFHKQNKKIISIFKNDDRFLLRFIGANAYSLKEYCESNNINNVELIDRFPPEKTLDYYFETDIVYNLYGNNTPLLDYALSNKLYYAAQLRIPILVCPNTFMENMVIQYGLGFSFDKDNPNALDNLYSSYHHTNWENFNEGCEEFMLKVHQDNLKFEKIVKQFIRIV